MGSGTRSRDGHTPGSRPRLWLAAANGHRIDHVEASRPQNGDDHRPMPKEHGEARLIETLTELEDGLDEEDPLWAEVVEWRAELRARRAKRRKERR